MFKNQSYHLLVVDDDPEVLRTMKKILERKGYQVTAVSSSVQALDTLYKIPHDLLITDLKMPEMDGIQLLNEAKKIRPDIPVILVTGFATIETAVSAMQWGAFNYLRKPFELKRIYEVVEQALAASKGR